MTEQALKTSQDVFIRTWAREIVTLAGRQVHGVELDIDETVDFLNEFLKSPELEGLEYRKLSQNLGRLFDADDSYSATINPGDVGHWLSQTFYELNSIVRKADRQERSVYLKAWSEAIHDDLPCDREGADIDTPDVKVIRGYLERLLSRPNLDFLKASDIERNLDLLKEEISADEQDDRFAQSRGHLRPSVEGVRQLVLAALTKS